MQGGWRHEPGSGGLRIGHAINLRSRAPNRQALFGVKLDRRRAATQDRPYEDFASACFLAIAATMPTIDISPIDLPMESSGPKTR